MSWPLAFSPTFPAISLFAVPYPQQTKTENQTLHVLSHKWELNNVTAWTQGGEPHTPELEGWEGGRESIKTDS